ncbi:lanthionine synthetase C family protein [Streptomonospora sp. S1-112]|uniref:Lanthionine synthetase C family protein n=1 Tax=Streptomonospora mangrovi TaxID=2883123 RepID=A0A9X3NNT5_9ACTN|nr:lanthionine synthetase C family protein [Streptomonospora mangrovi]MDA0565194.1 lanthionine synthetase C family protein [Streptomonospora mangrovi]
MPPADALPQDPASVEAEAGPPLSLARGALGIALVHLAAGSPAETAHAWLRTALAGGVLDPTVRPGLFHGLPAVAFTLALAPPDHYRRARATVREQLRRLVRHRLEAAHARIDRAEPASFGEYDLVSGLTGIAVAVWEADPDGELLEDVLAYLVRLCRPVRREGRCHPGWWVHHSPRGGHDPYFPDGHANLGMAHGIAGVVSLLGLTYRAGRTVREQRATLELLCAYLDSLQYDGRAGPWWPPWTVAHTATGPTRPGPPTWCYGTPGIARAQQIAALALGDIARRHTAERAMDACLVAGAGVDGLTAGGLCHGPAGGLRALTRMAEDQAPGAPRLRRHLLTVRKSAETPAPHHERADFLEGTAGTHLALNSGLHSRWDRCLLLA